MLVADSREILYTPAERNAVTGIRTGAYADPPSPQQRSGKECVAEQDCWEYKGRCSKGNDEIAQKLAAA